MRKILPISLLTLLAAGATSAADARADSWLRARRTAKSALGDFNADGFVDYADHDRGSGTFYVHANLGINAQLKPLGFSPNGVNWKTGYTSYETRNLERSSVLVGDFNGDHYADFLERNDDTGALSVHFNDKAQGGGFATWYQLSTKTCTGSACDVLVADFTGDGYADYADHDLATGSLYVHENTYRTTGVPGFAPVGTNWIVTTMCAPSAHCDTYAADFSGDGYADLAARDLATGAFSIYLYLPSSHTYSTSAWHAGTMCNDTHCEVLLGDFDGDGRSDFADHDFPTGSTYVHINHGVGQSFDPPGTNYLVFVTCGGATCDVLGAPGGQNVAPGTGVVTEGVSDFSTFSGGSHGNDIPGAAPNATGFGQHVTGGALTWQVQHAYTDNRVYDSDFFDPDVTNDPGDADGDGFDTPNTAISYFAGHGLSPGGVAAIACSHDSDCVPQGGSYRGMGHCQSWPWVQHWSGDSTKPGMCRWDWSRDAVVSSTADAHGHLIPYGSGNRSAGVALGESTHATWDWAGTNGDTNLVVWDLSFGSGGNFWQSDLIGPAAGAHLFATLMPIDGDTAMVSDRGSHFGDRARTSPYASVGDAWLAVMGDLGYEGHQCGDPNASYNAPGQPGYGWGGMNGCGCNLIVSFECTAQLAQTKAFQESWADLQNDGLDTCGDGYWTARWRCNYDPTGYVWSMP